MDHPHFTELADSTGLRKSAAEPGTATPRQRKYLQRIGAQWCAPVNNEWFETLNPANGEAWALIPHGTATDAERAVAAARSAFETGPWHDLNPTARGELMRKVATFLESHIEELVAIEARDNGRLRLDLTVQLRSLPKYFHYYAGLADKIEGAVIPNDVPGVFNYTRHEPLGVVVAITPWNSPLMLAVWKLAPALAAGNTVVLKPSEHASASTLELARLLELAGLPPGVVNVVTGFGQGVGAALVSHADVAKISFTGSDLSGKHIAAAAANGIKRVTLELGGKSAQLVFDDADMDTAVHGVLAGIFLGLGQSCIAGSRLLVQEAIHDRFVERLVAGMQNVRIGDPFDPRSQLGPVANQPQFEKVIAFIAQARADGATCVLGGQAAHPASCPNGCFLEPTIFTNVTSDMQLYRDEVFGPVLAISRFSDEDEAVRMANDSRFGLAAGVWTSDMARSVRLSQRIAAGTIYVNTYRSVSALSPVGGYKQSGYGRENGIEAIYEFLQTKSVWMGLTTVANPFPQDKL